MGAFMSTLGFNQVFFFTLVGLVGMLGLTVMIIRDSGDEDSDRDKETRALLGTLRNFNKIDLHKPSDDVLKSSPSVSGATLRNMGSTCIEFS